MHLSPSARLGSYEVVELLGVGGMGEVYRARDTRLNRDVALKILPESFALDPDRVARFGREAQALASLNHPNIAAIYGIEESNGVRALVLELVEGPTLADRIAQGAIPLDEALPIAKQIVAALEAAHEQGIIHRDLKPANIKIRPDGTVKVLDFGLAKALEPAVGAAHAADLTASPTITPPAMTMAGVILGTAAYMSPEQARGKTVDKRADIWAFGCVLYEMLTGRGAFEDEDVSMTLSKVLQREPDFSALGTSVPARVRQTLTVCLRKDLRQRAGDIHDVWLALEGAFETAFPQAGAPVLASLWRRVALASTAALLAGAGLATTLMWFAARPPPPAVVRTTVTTSGSAALTLSGTDRDVAITPDGARIVYRGNNQLLVRALDQPEPRVLSGLGAPRGLFISPDGQWIGFVDLSTIKRVAITGGPPEIVCPATGNPRGAAWSADGTIIFATDAVTTGLQRVSATGGEPTVLTTPDRQRGEGDHYWPEFLPGGTAVLFTIVPLNGAIEHAQIAVLDLQTRTWKVLINGGSHAHYVSTGHLVYGVTGALRAVAFDLGRLEVVGSVGPVLESVVTTGSGAADVSIAANGSLVYVPGRTGSDGQQTIVSVNRQGRVSPLPGLPPASYRDIRVSPDGARLALATIDDVWLYDFERETRTLLTKDPAQDTRPLWTLDATRIIFSSRRAGYPQLFWRPADGTGRDQLLLSRAQDLVHIRADAWSADGGQLLFSELSPDGTGAIGKIAIDRPSDAKMLLIGENFSYDYAAVSPNGLWMAYQSNESGYPEVFVERYPQLGERQQISSGGGRVPLWSRNGRELFFVTPDNRQILAAPVQPRQSATLGAGRPRVLFEFPMYTTGGSHPYDIGRDGQFLFIQRGQVNGGVAIEPNLILVQNWFEELKRLVPTK